jgi:hypothetical protein
LELRAKAGRGERERGRVVSENETRSFRIRYSTDVFDDPSMLEGTNNGSMPLMAF